MPCKPTVYGVSGELVGGPNGRYTSGHHPPAGCPEPPPTRVYPLQTQYKIIGTAGHIDHGKSALVRALTGTDPDRLQEEQDRGITIDLGFAHLDLTDELRVGFIDVPGHERFVKNMLAGIGGIDAVLFVIAADESVMPQTREHLSICELLGVDRGVVAITKSDLVDPEIADLVELEAGELLAGTFLADAPIVRTSAETGDGLDALRLVLADVLDAASERSGPDLTRLPIDRVFTVHGFGTVVTGTLLSGSIQAGAKLGLLPRGTHVTVRGVQVYGETVESAIAGQRTAVNLQGIEVGAVARGDLLVSPESLAATHMLDARLEMLPGHRLEQLQRVRFHHGAAEILCRAAVLDADEINEGSSGLVQLRLESPYACVPGDRFVIRRYSPMLTIGGGTIIDSIPVKHRRRDASTLEFLDRFEAADATDRFAALVASSGARGIGALDLLQRLGTTKSALAEQAVVLEGLGRLVVLQREPLFVIDHESLTALGPKAVAAVGNYHRAHPLHPAMPKSELTAALPRELPDAALDALIGLLVAQLELRGSANGVAMPSHDVALDPRQEEIRDSLLGVYEAAGYAPPSTDQALASIGASAEEGDALVRMLLRNGELVRLRDDLVFRAEQLARLVAELRGRHAAGDEFTVGEFKEWTGVSRKHAIPLLEYLDQHRVTRRQGDKRVRL